MWLDVVNLVFILSAIAFNLLIACILISEGKRRRDLFRMFGGPWLSPSVPLAIVFVAYLVSGRELWIMLCYGSILLYMLVEWLLDFVLRIEFRKKLVLHIPYIILEYIALFSFIGISFSIDRTWGWLVSISFWVLAASLVYLYGGPKKGTT